MRDLFVFILPKGAMIQQQNINFFKLCSLWVCYVICSTSYTHIHICTFILVVYIIWGLLSWDLWKASLSQLHQHLLILEVFLIKIFSQQIWRYRRPSSSQICIRFKIYIFFLIEYLSFYSIFWRPLSICSEWYDVV